jgi:hypothetical protein
MDYGGWSIVVCLYPPGTTCTRLPVSVIRVICICARYRRVHGYGYEMGRSAFFRKKPVVLVTTYPLGTTRVPVLVYPSPVLAYPYPSTRTRLPVTRQNFQNSKNFPLKSVNTLTRLNPLSCYFFPFFFYKFQILFPLIKTL